MKLVEGGQQSPLLRRVAGIRRQLVTELGYLLPPVRVTDNLTLRVGEYVISLKGVEIDRYEIPPGSEMAIHSQAGVAAPPEGVPTREPAFRLAAWWIPSHRAEEARAAGFTVVDPVSVLGTHLAEVVRRNAHELFSRQDAKRYVDRISEENPKVVEDLVPKLLPLSTVQRVLQNLLRERVSIRDGVSILEVLGEAALMTRNAVVLTEFVRQSIRRTVVRPYLAAGGELAAYFLEPSWERLIEGAVEHGEQTSQLNLAPQMVRQIVDGIAKVSASSPAPVVVLASSAARYFLRQAADSAGVHVIVIGHNEIPEGGRVVSLGVIQ